MANKGSMFSTGSGLARMDNATLMGDLLPVSQCSNLEPIAIEGQQFKRSGKLQRVMRFSDGEGKLSRASHGKPPLDKKEMIHVKKSTMVASGEARVRANRFDSIKMLSMYGEAALGSKKLQRNEQLTNERATGTKKMKFGTQMPRKPLDVAIQGLEGITKTVLNKPIHTSMAEIQVEGRISDLPKHPSFNGKEREVRNDGSCREGLDTKVKRKRSVSRVCTKNMDGSGDFQQSKHFDELSLRSCDTLNLRSLNGSRCTDKLDSVSSPTTSYARGTAKNERETGFLPSGLSTESKNIARRTYKLKNREDKLAVKPSPIHKGRGSSSSSFTQSSKELESCEYQALNVNKVQLISGSKNQKRSRPIESSSAYMAQQLEQRPKKVCCTRKTDHVSPISTLDETHTSNKECTTDLGAKIINSTNKVSFLPRSEQPRAGENRLKKTKIVNEQYGDGVTRQRRSRNSSFIKPLRNTGSGPVKVGRSGLHTEKLSERKSLIHPFKMSNFGSPILAGYSDDEQEDILAAAKYASKMCYLSSSSSFWKKIEPSFELLSLDKISYLEQQLDFPNKEISHFQAHAFEERVLNLENQAGLKDLVDPFEDHVSFSKQDVKGIPKEAIPLFQRLLSALIVEDESEEFEAEDTLAQYYKYNEPPSQTFLHTDCGLINGQDRQYNLDERVLMELEMLGLYPERMPDLAEQEEEMVTETVSTLNKEVSQMANEKQTQLKALHKAIQDSKEAEGRDLEDIAMQRLVEMAYRKYLATFGSKSGATKVSKQAATEYMSRTLDRCREFEVTGKSIFMKPPFKDVLFATRFNGDEEDSLQIINRTDKQHHEAYQSPSELKLSASLTNKGEPHGGVNETVDRSKDQTFAKPRSISNREKKKEVLLDKVGACDALRPKSSLKKVTGKRSLRGKNKNSRTPNPDSKNKQVIKSKPKQKTNKPTEIMLPPSGSGSIELAMNGQDLKDPLVDVAMNLDLADSIADLGQDIGTWLDDDGLQDEDFVGGLEIPMDDLSMIKLF